MSNNIYNILGNLAKLAPKEETPKEKAQAIYESVEAKGSISEGVNKIEKKLAEQLASMKEASYVHKGTYGTEYQGDADDEEEEQKKADTGTRGRGRPRKHAAKEKVAGRGRGRPKKDKKSSGNAGKSLQDIFVGKMPKKPAKGTLVKGRAMSHPDNKKGDDLDEKANNPYAIGMAQAEKSTGDRPPLKKSTITKAHDIAKKIVATESKLAKRMLSESCMIDESGETLNHILNRFKAEVKQFKQGAELDNDLYEALFDYYFDQGEMPYGVAKARTGDPYEWVTQRLDQEVQDSVQDEGIDPTNPRDYEIPTIQRKAAGQEPLSLDDVKAKDEKAARDYRIRAGLEEELNELAKLAGLQTESKFDPEKFGSDGAGAGAGDIKKDDDEVDGKKDKVEESCGSLSPVGSAAAEMDTDNLNVTTSYNAKDGRKSISINAEGEMAEQLAQMLKLSGLAGGKPQQGQPEVKVVQLSAPEEVEEERDPEYVNSPNEEVADVEAVTDQGDDLNRQKKQFAGKPKAGDNPMASEDFDPIEAMGRKLMKEYESIKVQK
jgi:hypothetical protein